jgi:hypothetical protein
MKAVDLLCAASLFGLLGCTDPSDANSAAGAYFGDVAIDHNTPSQSVFASISITIEDNGQAQGTLLTKSPTQVVGDPGTVTGVMEIDGVAGLAIDLALDFDQTGEFSLSGRITHSEADGSFGGSVVTRDGSDTVIGMTTLVARQE